MRKFFVNKAHWILVRTLQYLVDLTSRLEDSNEDLFPLIDVNLTGEVCEWLTRESFKLNLPVKTVLINSLVEAAEKIVGEENDKK